MPTKTFVSFGGPTESYRKRVKELHQEADQSKMFDHIITFTDQDLEKDQEFWETHGEFISNPKHQRGYGFWLWKPYIIMKVMDLLEYGDFLVYADAGCTINSNGGQRFQEYQSMLNSNPFGLLAYQLYACNDIEYIKRATLEYIGATEHDKNTPQIITTALVIKKTNKSMEFIKRWYEFASMYDLINDDSHQENEYPEFKDHRHDQAIFSLLVKQEIRKDSQNGPIVIGDETYFPNDWHGQGGSYPFWGTRHR